MAKSRRIVPNKPFNGGVIRQLRKNRDLSQARLGELSKMGKGNISKLERSRTYVAMSWDNFMDLARALYIPPEELARRLTEPPSTSPAPHSPTADKRSQRA